MFSRLLAVAFFVEELQEGRTHDSSSLFSVSISRSITSSSVGGVGARAALSLLGFACGLLALKSTLGLLAVGGLAALPFADGIFANGRTLGFWSSAGSMALGRRADSFTLGASLFLAHIFRATNRAGRSFTVNGTFSTEGFLTAHLALGSFAYRMADSRARRIITLPFTFRMTLFSRGISTNDHHSKNNSNKQLHLSSFGRYNGGEKA